MQVFDGQKAKMQRKYWHLTQYELADKTGIAQTRISDIERNVSKPKDDEIDKLLAGLKCHRNALFSDQEDIKVVVNTFTKGKKRSNGSKEKQINFPKYSDGVEFGTKINEFKQLELFDEKSLIGQDLTGFVLITNDEYKKLIDSKKRLEKFENIFSEVKNG
ncbi:helix-turn-helix domain-containing protein [Streptococcus agalactiae]|uniref:helix-turn-helix domain-containing protein n=1 Tax=Streptococcus agalactiae TaxID=1311 RepID=UPI0024BB98C2|nr:helix-turn-helix transcriptional regulator [Streptococcus agalactiae]